MEHTRLPAVSGPIEGGGGNIFRSPIEDLGWRGFVMDEYFFEGTAVGYAPTEGAELRLNELWDVEPPDEASFETRAYVGRPRRSGEVQRHSSCQPGPALPGPSRL